MQISHVRIDHFGRWSNMTLNGFSSGLNVLYGPRGAGKSTIAEFLRTMLFGRRPDRQRTDLPAGERYPIGSLGATSDAGNHTVCRWTEETHRDCIAVYDEHGVSVGDRRLPDWLDGVDRSHFQQVFLVSCGVKPSIDALIDWALEHGYNLSDYPSDSRRREDILQAIDLRQQDLDRITDEHDSLPWLLDRLRDLEMEIDSLLDLGRRHAESSSREWLDQTSQVAGWQRRLDELHVALKKVETAIEAMAYSGRAAVSSEQPWMAIDSDLQHLRHRRDEILWDIENTQASLAEYRSRHREGELRNNQEVEERLAARRRELQDLQRRIQDTERGEQLREEIAGLEYEVRHLRVRHDVDLGRGSAEYLGRLTCQQLRRLHFTDDYLLLVEDEHGARLRYSELGVAGQVQVYLSLCLAIVDRCWKSDSQLPLILDDLCQHQDPTWTQATIEVLLDFARRGHQILALTGDWNLVQAMHTQGALIHHLPYYAETGETHYQSAGPAYEPAYRTRYDALEPITASHAPTAAGYRASDYRASDYRVSDHAASDYGATEYRNRARDTGSRSGEYRHRREYDRASIMAPRTRTFRNDTDEVHDAAAGYEPPEGRSRYFLRETDDISQAPSIDAVMAARLRSLGIVRIGDLLSAAPADVSVRLREAHVDPETIRRWQSESLLVCRVPNLRRYDARILVACGVCDPTQLSRTPREELLARVQDFLATRYGQRLLQMGSEYERSRLLDWLSSVRNAPSSYSRDRDYVRSEFTGRPNAAPRPVRPTREPDAPAPSTRQGDGRPRRRRVRDRSDAAGPSSRDRNGGEARYRRTRTYETRPAPRSGAAPDILNIDRPQNLRFYLSTNSAIVDAPSIGPRLAQQLEAIGIVTVADLLNADVQATATRLGSRRIKAETIREWQHQATLCTRVPELRGHDAQLLVACGVTEPEQLAQMDPKQLAKRVTPLVETTEGKRILRNGKAPDSAEIQEWIRWAQHSRSLHAAV